MDKAVVTLGFLHNLEVRKWLNGVELAWRMLDSDSFNTLRKDDRNSVCAYGAFTATHTGEGGPCPPTGESMTTDYVYVMDFDGDKIRTLTKIWNAGWAMKELGWGLTPSSA